MKGGQCSHNHLAFKCTAGVGIKQREKHNKKKEKHNYTIEEGGSGGQVLAWAGAATQGKISFFF